MGENAADYDELVARLCAAVRPVDVIDEMFINDVVSLEWEVSRWRRLKLSLIRGVRTCSAARFFDRTARLRSVLGTVCG